MEYDRSLFTCQRSKQWLLSKSFRLDWLAIKYRNEPSGVKSHQKNFPRVGSSASIVLKLFGSIDAADMDFRLVRECSVVCSSGFAIFNLSCPAATIFHKIYLSFIRFSFKKKSCTLFSGKKICSNFVKMLWYIEHCLNWSFIYICNF